MPCQFSPGFAKEHPGTDASLKNRWDSATGFVSVDRGIQRPSNVRFLEVSSHSWDGHRPGPLQRRRSPRMRRSQQSRNSRRSRSRTRRPSLVRRSRASL
eukprot:s6404_g1.t1